MTGPRGAWWSWAARAALPGALVAGEAAWASVLVGAAANSSRPRVDLPFVALAVPAAAATFLGAWTARPGWQRRVPFAAAAIVFGLVLTAGTLGGWSGAPWAAAAAHPWSLHGHAAAMAAAAWAVGGAAWARGLWASVAPLSVRHAAWSAGLGAATFVGVFAGRAGGSAGLRAATGDAGWLLFVWFPLTVAVLALGHQRDLARTALAGEGHQPSGVWLGVLAGPLAVVALVALGFAAAVGPAAAVVGHAVVVAASAVATALGWGVAHVWDLLPKGHPHRAPAPGGAAGGRSPAGASGQVSISVPPAVGGVLIAFGAVVVALFAFRHVRPSWSRHRRAGRAAGEESSESIFSWGHVGDQLRAALRRLLLRRRPARQGPTGPAAHVAATVPADERGVRPAYRRVLAALRRAGHGRAAGETPLELRSRVAGELGPDAADALGALTDLYDRVRYGELAPTPTETEQAGEDAAALAAALDHQPAQGP